MTDLPDSAAPTPPTRRGLLKTLAALGALSVTGGAPSALAAPSATPRLPLRVGLVLPARSLYPDLGAAFTRGVRAGAPGQAVELLTYSTGPLPREAAQAAQAALDDGCEALILLGDGLAAALAGLLHARPVPVLAAELGALLPGTHRPAPLTVTLSLRTWEAEWGHGQALARSASGAAVHLLMSDVEAGYDLPYAFSAGFTAAGGTLAGSTVFASRRPDVAGAVDAVRVSGARAAHVLASGQGAEVILALQQAGLSVTKGGLTAPGLAGVPSVLAAPSRADGLASAALGDDAGHPGAQLGFDAGRWMVAGLSSLPATAGALAQYSGLMHAAVPGARGPLRANESGLAGTPLWRRGGGLPDKPLADGPAGLHRGEDLRSGWLYTYLHA